MMESVEDQLAAFDRLQKKILGLFQKFGFICNGLGNPTTISSSVLEDMLQEVMADLQDVKRWFHHHIGGLKIVTQVEKNSQVKQAIVQLLEGRILAIRNQLRAVLEERGQASH